MLPRRRSPDVARRAMNLNYQASPLYRPEFVTYVPGDFDHRHVYALLDTIFTYSSFEAGRDTDSSLRISYAQDLPLFQATPMLIYN